MTPIQTLALYLAFFFFFNDTATTEIYTLSLHDALPIWALHGGHPALPSRSDRARRPRQGARGAAWARRPPPSGRRIGRQPLHGLNRGHAALRREPHGVVRGGPRAPEPQPDRRAHGARPPAHPAA